VVEVDGVGSWLRPRDATLSKSLRLLIIQHARQVDVNVQLAGYQKERSSEAVKWASLRMRGVAGVSRYVEYSQRDVTSFVQYS
jgi:hypothetical protein